jgi:hypothetical protein
MGSNATVTTNNMELTPMIVKYGPSGSQVDLGGTLGNVVLSAKYNKAEIKADQSGISVRDRRVSGVEVTVTTELTEIQNKDRWAVVFPHATFSGSGTTGNMVFNANIGDSDQSNAKVLTLHPMSKDVSDLNHDYTFYKATASAESTITYGPTNQAALKIVWNILPDESTTPNRWFKYGI